MFKRVSRLSFMAVILFVLVFTVGCGGNVPSDDNYGQQGDDGSLSGTIQIAGSTSVQPLSEELAMEFMARNPKVKISVAGGGSGAGIKSVQNGTADIGASSRELKPQEKTVKEFVIARDGIAVIVHPDNPIEDIRLDDLKKVFTGEITNWKEIGGKNAPIAIVIREEGSGTRSAFQELTIGEDAKFSDNAIIQNSTGAVRTAVAQNPDAIGFISIGAISDDIKTIAIDGVEPAKENVLNNSYKISRPFIYMTKDEPEGIVKSFIDFVLSHEGQQIVQKEFINVK